MEREIIVTDLTRFQTGGKVCTAGFDRKTGECIRPMPYLTDQKCREVNLLPGAILSGEFTKLPSERPHVEDYRYSSLKYRGPASSEEFLEVLQKSTFPSVSEGFEIQLGDRQKHIPPAHPVQRSIITIAVSPDAVEVVPGYKEGTIKLSFRDGAGQRFQFLSITDLGFYEHAIGHHAQKDLDVINHFFEGQSAIYLRIGLGRAWTIKEVTGYWMQVNGIYTFPSYLKEIRGYQ